MLRITQQSSSDAAKQYYARADYYAEGQQEMVGRWGGEGAKRLGLEGIVARGEFNLLCENRDPCTGQRLTIRTKQNRSVGYDFTFSVPKSVSLLHALTQDKSLLEAFRDSVHETMDDIEKEMKARVRKGGRNEERQTGNLVYAEFVHHTSRPVDGIPDPQLHAHCFVFNATFDGEEGTWKAGQFRDLKRDAPLWQAMFRVRLANRLQELGYAIERKRDDFEVAGVPNSALKKFSRRTAVIEEEAVERGITDPEKKAELGRKTREAKNEELSWNQLRHLWKDRLSSTELAALVAVRKERTPGLLQAGGEKQAVDHALLHCFERAAVVPEKQLLAEALRRGVGSVTLADVREELARRPLLGREVDGRWLVTAPEVLALEKGLIAFARDGRGTCKPLVGFDRSLARPWLDRQQQEAVRHLWQSPDRVMLLRGAAGTGKTTLLQEAVEGIEAAGHRVLALAPSADASRGVLREAGMKDADTVARFLVDIRMQAQARQGVLLIDEASLVGTRTLSRLFGLAEELEARVILVGDPRQHRSVEMGKAFELLQERAGIPVAEVSDIRRQQGRYKDAVQALGEGRVLEGFDLLDELGWVKELPDGKREQQLVADYLHAVSEKKANGTSPSVLVISPTHAEISRVTSSIRMALRQAGKLGEERCFAVWQPTGYTEAERADPANLLPGYMLQFHQHAPGRRSGERLVVHAEEELPVRYAGRYQVYAPAELRLAVGDRLRVTANGKTKEGNHRLNNRDLFTVQGFTSAGDIVVDKGWVIGRDFGHIDFGYAVTSHASQGKTVDRVLLAQSSLSFPASSCEQAYVSASRARESVTIYTDDRQALRAAIRRGDERLSASDLVNPKQRGIEPRLKKYLALMRQRASNLVQSLARESRLLSRVLQPEMG